MTLRNGFPAVSDAADQFDIRAALRANIAQDADGNIKQGLAPTASSLAGVVTSRDDMQCDVAAFSAAIDRQGPVFLHHEGTDQVTITPAPAANSRIDSIWVKQQESAAPLSDSTDGPAFGVTDGTPNANPVPPEIPEGALQLATITIPSTATSTSSSGVIITNTYPFTASLGGQIYFRSDTEMQEWTPVEGQKAFIPTGDKAGEYVGKSAVWDSVTRTSVLRGKLSIIKNGIAGGAFFHAQVTFEKPFKSIPDVFVTSDEPVFVVAAQNVSATGFVYWLHNTGSSPNGEDRYPKWVAVGESA